MEESVFSGNGEQEAESAWGEKEGIQAHHHSRLEEGTTRPRGWQWFSHVAPRNLLERSVRPHPTPTESESLGGPCAPGVTFKSRGMRGT